MAQIPIGHRRRAIYLALTIAPTVTAYAVIRRADSTSACDRASNQLSTTPYWQPQRDSNPCRHLERVVS